MNEWGPTVGIGPLIFFSPTAIFYETSFKKVSQRLPKLLHKYPYPLFYCFMLCFSISFILGRCDTFVLQSCRVQTVEINIITTLWRYLLFIQLFHNKNTNYIPPFEHHHQIHMSLSDQPTISILNILCPIPAKFGMQNSVPSLRFTFLANHNLHKSSLRLAVFLGSRTFNL